MAVVKDIKYNPNSCTKLFSTFGETMNYLGLCIQSKIMKMALNIDEGWKETSLLLNLQQYSMYFNMAWTPFSNVAKNFVPDGTFANFDFQ
jgi:hypothetical protein